MIISEVPRLRVLVAEMSLVKTGLEDSVSPTLVGTFLELSVVACLLNNIQDLLGEGFIGDLSTNEHHCDGLTAE